MVINCSEYYFSPTGGTKAVANIVSRRIGDHVNKIDLGKEMNWSYISKKEEKSHVSVFAVPVYGGRVLPQIIDKLRKFEGNGKPAVALVVFGNRDFDDALLELSDVLTECGYKVIAAAAAVSRHSMSPVVAQGRPDEKDAAGIIDFAVKARAKVENIIEDPDHADSNRVKVKGNVPYCEYFTMHAAPLVNDQCTLCMKCDQVCPTYAVTVENGTVSTDTDLCMLCMACVAECPTGARYLPDDVQKVLDKKLEGLINVRKENQYFL